MRTLTILAFLLISFCAFTNTEGTYTQNVRGRVVDRQTQVPLEGAAVQVFKGEFSKGTITDSRGYFEIKDVPIGRVSIMISYLGYFPWQAQNVPLTTGKELVVNAKLEQQVIITEEVVVVAEKDKTRANNKMAVISARQFTIEESQRYAGARNDVSRMATNYAGVSAANDAVNNIVIRGNSPQGLLWQLEGVPIPNPNHFGGMGATGGPVSMLNNNVLANSDFITSAFPAEYGNATSGVFDLALREGNYQQHEFLGQISFNGFELGAEGPISRKNKSSYLVNYRYSTMGLMADMGYDVGTGTAVPYYQDVSFNLNMPTKKMGTFKLYGMGGINHIEFMNSEDTSSNVESFYENDWMDIYNANETGMVGLSHTYIINPKTYYKATVAASHINNLNELDSIDQQNKSNLIEFWNVKLSRTNVIAQAYINHKFNSRHNIKIGGRFTKIYYSLIDSSWNESLQTFETNQDESGNTQQISSYMQWQYKPSDKLEFNTGVHYELLTLANQWALEPRLGAKYRIKSNQSINLGYGLHSRRHPMYMYFDRVNLPAGGYIQPNTDLDFTKSHHLVLGYDWNISEYLRTKTEIYYQRLFDVVVDQNPSTFSSINLGSQVYNVPDSLKNGGWGQNYGVELTIERFINNGYYYLATVSLFDSKYKGSDGVKRSTQFDSDYVVNVLGGKEFELSKKKEKRKKQRWISVDIAVTAAGGQRYIPLDVEASIASGSSEYDYENAFTQQFDDYFRADLRIAYRADGKRASQEIAVDIQNITDHKNPFSQQINLATGEQETTYQLGFFPMLQYRITF